MSLLGQLPALPRRSIAVSFSSMSRYPPRSRRNAAILPGGTRRRSQSEADPRALQAPIACCCTCAGAGRPGSGRCNPYLSPWASIPLRWRGRTRSQRLGGSAGSLMILESRSDPCPRRGWMIGRVDHHPRRLCRAACPGMGQPTSLTGSWEPALYRREFPQAHPWLAGRCWKACRSIDLVLALAWGLTQGPKHPPERTTPVGDRATGTPRCSERTACIRRPLRAHSTSAPSDTSARRSACTACS